MARFPVRVHSAHGPPSRSTQPAGGTAIWRILLGLALALAGAGARISAEPSDNPGHHHHGREKPSAGANATPPGAETPAPAKHETEVAGVGDIFSKKTTEIAYQTIESWMEGDVRVTVLLGNVEMRQEGMLLRADSIVGWYDEVAAKAREEAAKREGKKAPNEPIFDEFYAEGFVRMVREFEVVEADQMYFDLLNNTGLVLETTIRTIDVKNKTPLVVRAKELHQLDRTRYVADDAQISTCDYGDPHLSVKVGKVEFQRDRQGSKASFRHVSTQNAGIPFFYLPFYWTRLGQSYPLRSVSYSNSGRLGHTVRTDWGFDLRRYVRNDAGEIEKDENGKPKEKKWGDILVNLDYMSNRGPGAGVDTEYGWENYSGYLNTYFVNDAGPVGHGDLDKAVMNQDLHNRWRVKAFHRQQLAPEWRADFEFSRESDRFFLREFFEKEFKEGKAQETYAYLRHTHENLGATLFANVRMNDFQNQNEYLPQAAFYWIAEPVLSTGVYYTNFTNFSNVRDKFDDDLHIDSDRIMRFDTYHELSAPINLSVLQVAPFVAARYTTFEDDLAHAGGTDRFIGTAGVRAFAQLHREYDTQWNAVGLHGLRHLVSVDTRYTNNLTTSERSSELIQYDSIDKADAFEELSIEFRNRFQTHKTGTDESFEFLSLGLEAEYYPDAERDVFARRDQNFLYPMGWIPVSPKVNGVFQQRRWSNLFFDAEFTPNAPFALHWDMEFSQYGEGVEVDHAYASYTPSKKLRVTLGHNFVDGISNALAVGVQWQATDKWRIKWEEQYEFDRAAFIKSRLGLQRDMHDFQIEVFTDYDEGKDDFTFGFLVLPEKKGRSRETYLDNYGYLHDH